MRAIRLQTGANAVEREKKFNMNSNTTLAVTASVSAAALQPTAISKARAKTMGRNCKKNQSNVNAFELKQWQWPLLAFALDTARACKLLWSFPHLLAGVPLCGCVFVLLVEYFRYSYSDGRDCFLVWQYAVHFIDVISLFTFLMCHYMSRSYKQTNAIWLTFVLAVAHTRLFKP